MKKSYIKWLLFFLLMLVLAAGLSYLSFNHTAKVEQDQAVKGMSIALVNEDEGASFNSSEIAFGAAFVESVEKNNEHDWYVVSRGVAESGIEKNTYDMMIVIPNDFSKKALSIQSEAPEQVVLNYKINAKGNEDVESEAEKTASTVLNNFNKQIIDVYFASIIGNLQNAQDSIAEIINEQAEYTYTYNHSVETPLANYTTQFETVKSQTEISKESFSGLEELLASFDEILTEDAETVQNYQSSIRDAAELQNANEVLAIDFYNMLRGLNEGMGSADVEQRLQSLEASNKLIQNQFEQAGNDTATILSGTAKLQVHFKDMLDLINRTEAKVNEKLNPEKLNAKAKETVSNVLDGVFPEDESLKISTLMQEPDKKVRENIRDLISRLPSLNESDFEKIGLPKQTVREIKNVIAVTKKYNQDIEYVAPRIDNGDLLSDNIREIKNHLRNEGVTVKDTVRIPENKKPGQTFELTNVPDNYKVTQLTIKMPNGETYSGKSGEIKLPANKKGKFTVTATFKLTENDPVLDIYEPITWSWKLVQKDTTDTADKQEKNDKPEKTDKEEKQEIVSLKSATVPEIAVMQADSVNGGQPADSPLNNEPTDKPKNDSGDPSIPNEDSTPPASNKDNEQGSKDNKEPSENSGKTEKDGADSGEATDPSGEKDKENNNESGKGDSEAEVPENGNDQGDSENSGEKDESEQPGDDKEDNEEELDDADENETDEEDDEEQEDEIETVEVINNTIKHQVSSQVTDLDNTTKTLIQSAAKTISPYEKLASQYESYFGLNINGKNLTAVLNKGSLKEIASDSSLYAVFNKKDIATLVEDYVAGRAMDEVKGEIRTPLEKLQAQIATYRQLVGKADENAAQLAEKVAKTREQALAMNEQLAGILENVTQWREQSLNMVDQHTEIQEFDDEEQMAVMSLADDFQPLLSQSQSLADQAGSNLHSAETVYQTFDAIDEQATTIQESGVELVDTAEDLSVNMTNKLLDDQEFVENFTNVLANSRVGDRQNEDLYDFLSNPVETKSEGVITSNDNSEKYFIVLICFIVALFTAYVISTSNQKRLAEDPFESEQSLIGENALITAITAGIGIAEGLIIGLVSGYFLNFAGADLLMWTALIVFVMASMLLISAYLLRQMKMIGMFFLLAMLSLYLFVNGASGSGSAALENLGMYSPLAYVENAVSGMIQGTGSYALAIVVFLAVSIIGVLANLLVLKPSQKRDVEDDSDDKSMQEAN